MMEREHRFALNVSMPLYCGCEECAAVRNRNAARLQRALKRAFQLVVEKVPEHRRMKACKAVARRIVRQAVRLGWVLMPLAEFRAGPAVQLT